MTATFSQVRAALAGQVQDRISGLMQVQGLLLDSVTPPAVLVQPAPGDFLLNPVMGEDACDYLFYVTLYTPGEPPEAGQALLDDYLAPSGPLSVMAAINADETLGGVVSSAKCNRARNYRHEQPDQQRFIAVDFPVQVMT